MAYTTVDDSSANFQIATYTGNGSNPRNITNDGNSDLQPDLVWLKNRTDNSTDFVLANSSIGWDAPKGQGYPWENGPFGGQMASNSNGAESTPQATYGYVSAALTDGFTAAAGGTNGDTVNKNTKEFVAWQWKANGGTTTSVSASGTGSGCVNACTHQANTTAGISIITYTGRDDQLNNGQHSLLKHGLGVAPDFMMLKRRDAAGDWYVMGKHVTSASAYSNNEYLSLNDTDGINGNSYTGSVAPTSTDIYLGNELVNIASATYVMYAFAETQGFSKFGSYIGSGARDYAPFIYTGFQPALIMVKDTVSAHGWSMFDNKRVIANGDMHYLAADRTDAESGSGFSHNDPVDFMSNGFRIMNADAWMNTVNRKYIYMAFAQHPFTTSTGIPTTAR